MRTSGFRNQSTGLEREPGLTSLTSDRKEARGPGDRLETGQETQDLRKKEAESEFNRRVRRDKRGKGKGEEHRAETRNQYHVGTTERVKKSGLIHFLRARVAGRGLKMRRIRTHRAGALEVPKRRTVVKKKTKMNRQKRKCKKRLGQGCVE